jgi:hypothetical protein
MNVLTFFIPLNRNMVVSYFHTECSSGCCGTCGIHEFPSVCTTTAAGTTTAKATTTTEETSNTEKTTTSASTSECINYHIYKHQ